MTAGDSPVPSRFLSPAVLEALTTYSPAAAALNDLAELNLQLVRRFAETSRGLHASVVASLEEETYRYHTLEEAQRYIRRHKPPPLTLEQARKQLEEENQD
ncbi:hypothetical protein JRQ81_008784 [Phrynocephalus forsythii]|uniref:DUF4614 domain-containing protein n=1 Tax=Phrynocephalus forsythii TaxID=171643 RepID=A0A9Q1ASA9_9SAUR|nr:hypothetical protein JRQ81_008784 [Phrynocephalus forsythii]